MRQRTVSDLADPLRTVGVRDYHPEDSFRHLHWKATARAQQLQVRVFEPTTVTQLGPSGSRLPRSSGRLSGMT